MRSVEMQREWAMPNRSTFRIPPIARFVERHLDTAGGMHCWVDPFVRDSPFRNRMTLTNDLDPSFEADYHLDALDFLRSIPDASLDGVLFDPPYSPRQVAECYRGVGREVTSQDTQSRFWGDLKKEMGRIVWPGGKVLCFGWNSGGAGKSSGFRLEEVLLVAHGGWHNDTICTAEVRT